MAKKRKGRRARRAKEAKRRAAAERAMRLQFVQGIKKKGMTDFEVSMIQESRKGGRVPVGGVK